MYLRKSRADDPLLSVEEVLSKHETRLDEWVDRNLTAPIPTGNRFKEVVSGESIADRPEFQKVLKLVESPSIKAVLVVEVHLNTFHHQPIQQECNVKYPQSLDSTT